MAKFGSQNVRHRTTSWRRIVWVVYAKLCTLFIPDKLLIYLSNGRLATKARREAWREKIALFLSYLLIGTAFCLWLEVITVFFCDVPPTFNYKDIYNNHSHYSSINGDVVDWRKLGNKTEMTEQVNLYPHYDLSAMFPQFMVLQRPEDQLFYNNRIVDECINGNNRRTEADNWLKHKLATDPGYVFEHDKLVSCPFPYQRNLTGSPCFYSLIAQHEYARRPKKGALKFDVDAIYANFSSLPHNGKPGKGFVILDGQVLDVTDYLDSATNIVRVAKGVYSRSFALDRLFLPLDLTILLFVHLGEDISDKFYASIENADSYKECLITLFQHGVIEGGEDVGCARINMGLWITMGCFLIYFLLKMNLANLSRLKWLRHILHKSVPTNQPILIDDSNSHGHDEKISSQKQQLRKRRTKLEDGKFMSSSIATFASIPTTPATVTASTTPCTDHSHSHMSRMDTKSNSNSSSNSIISTTRFLYPLTLLFIPCFAESSEAIKQTFDSLARTSYPDACKLLFFVCDGTAKSDTDSKETYLCILDSLGYSSTEDPDPRAYVSLGQGTRKINYAKVYAGFYESGRNRVPFMMVVKVGSPSEALSTTRIPGNRGKRDSMVLLLGFLERCLNLAYNRITPLEFELFNLCYNVLSIDPRDIKYMLVTDADIQVQDDVVFKLVSRLEADRKILAINGHIRPANPEENLVTMLQIVPLYMTFFAGLAYEACLGCVTSINGGFVMYRIWSEASSSASNSKGEVYKATTDTVTALYHHQRPNNSLLSDASSTQDTEFEGDIKLRNVELQQPFRDEQHLHLQPDISNSNRKPKVSDEIITPRSLNSDNDRDIEEGDDDDNTSCDDNDTTTTMNTTATTFHHKSIYRRRKRNNSSRNINASHHHHGQIKQSEDATSTTFSSLKPNRNIIPCCIKPTVLRGFAAPRPNTMHMENILLLGEEQYFGLVLLRSHPGHRIAFEPEAIAYATIPSNFFALQALQLRNIRVTFHTQIEFHHISKHLGFMYWLVSITKILDMIFSMPFIVYLYTIYIRYFHSKDLAYAIIAGSFTCLVALHIFYFLIRRQFKYVLWFILYGLFSVPIFNVYFPLLAVWCTDYANRWYDVWPTDTTTTTTSTTDTTSTVNTTALSTGRKRNHRHTQRGRLHGILMDDFIDRDDAYIEEEELEAEENIMRMRLADFEVLEAAKTAQKEKEQQELLDAKFSGFTGYVSSAAAAANNNGHTSRPSWSSSLRLDSPASFVSTPPLVQIRDAGKLKKTGGDGHSRLASDDDANRYILQQPNNSGTNNSSGSGLGSKHQQKSSIVSLETLSNPFASNLDDPFDDAYGVSNIYSRQHRPTQSQSSYYSRTSMTDYPYYTHDLFVPEQQQTEHYPPPSIQVSASNLTSNTPTPPPLPASAPPVPISSSSVQTSQSQPYSLYQQQQPIKHRIRSCSSSSPSIHSSTIRQPPLAYPTFSASTSSTLYHLHHHHHHISERSPTIVSETVQQKIQQQQQQRESMDDNDSILSMNHSLSSFSIISLERNDATDSASTHEDTRMAMSPPRHHHFMHNAAGAAHTVMTTMDNDEDESEGRSAPVHSRILSKQ
ncbi:chitin synthase-domain-containing protein [Mycotypha africana]|uniref:chitin synthase-domain-containing protein n=1 Tax=Mycotypha africana TaxID=64632 RepID=UPI0023002368|nr:chitin synthase-domain-containing protein [Mycotypha africana]KAI8988223.1 chitin synthase-domain-containing protein [Mycotypha africana]